MFRFLSQDFGKISRYIPKHEDFPLHSKTYGKYHSLSDLSSVEVLLNKLRFAMSNLTSQTQNIEASRSRIQGTDFAADVADLAKNQILAQASAISQNILPFLR